MPIAGDANRDIHVKPHLVLCFVKKTSLLEYLHPQGITDAIKEALFSLGHDFTVEGFAQL